MTRNPFVRSATDLEAVMQAQYRLLQAMSPASRPQLAVVVPEHSASAPPLENGVGIGLGLAPSLDILAGGVAELVVAGEPEIEGISRA